jgi:hypothetical protein
MKNIIVLSILAIQFSFSQGLSINTNEGLKKVSGMTYNYESIMPDSATIFLSKENASTAYLALSKVKAGLDSFATTNLTKEITVTGAIVGGAVIVTPAYPAYSATADTGFQYSGVVKAGGGAITITRSAYHAGGVPKSAGIFNYLYIKP